MGTASKSARHRGIRKKDTIPYGTLVGASEELRMTYYFHGWKDDNKMPESPCSEWSDDIQDPEEILERKQVSSVLSDVLDSLTPRRAKILRYRFGIGISHDMTLDEIAIRYDVTRERIRQIEKHAFRLLRNPVRLEILKGLVDYQERES